MPRRENARGAASSTTSLCPALSVSPLSSSPLLLYPPPLTQRLSSTVSRLLSPLRLRSKAERGQTSTMAAAGGVLAGGAAEEKGENARLVRANRNPTPPPQQ